MEKIIITEFENTQEPGKCSACRIQFANYTGKTIKYMYVELKHKNRVGDVVNEACFRVTGPFYANDPTKKSAANVAMFSTEFLLGIGDSICICLEDSSIEYMDGEEESLDCAVINRAYKGVSRTTAPPTAAIAVTLVMLVIVIVIWSNVFSSCSG